MAQSVAEVQVWSKTDLFYTKVEDALGIADQVIRGKPGAASERCRGTETSAEDLVGPPERMVSERRSTAVVRGDPKRSWRQPNGRLRPANRHPPPSASYSASEGTGGARGLGNLVRPESPRATRFPGAVGRSGGQAGDRSPPIAPFGPALVPVLPRVDRAVRTVSPAVCSHVRCAIICACIGTVNYG